MKRLPRGGKKVNHTLYISQEHRAKIQERASDLDMTESYYLMTLVFVESELDLIAHLESGGSIELVEKEDEGEDVTHFVPKVAAPMTDEEEKKFSENIQEKFTPEGEIALPDKEALKKLEQDRAMQQPHPQAAPEQPVIERPMPKTFADLMQESGIPGMNTANMGGMANTRPAHLRGPGNWQQKIHKELQSDQKSEAAFRKKILDNLPPLEEDNNDA
ncbi:MAG: hypothetical protein ACXAEN_19200 [Candidatus Thorarchaeota archaeon]|jgi:hypothetical protein